MLNLNLSLVTVNEFPDLLLFALKQQPHTDRGEVPIGHLFVPQDPLQQPLQVGLRGLQSLPTASEISNIGRPFPTWETSQTAHFLGDQES